MQFVTLFSETIKVFDGNCSLRRRIFRAITVSRTCSLEQLLTTSLRAFHIARDPDVIIHYIQLIKNSETNGFCFSACRHSI